MLFTVILILTVILDLFLALLGRIGVTLPTVERDPKLASKYGIITYRAGFVCAAFSAGILVGLHLK